VRIDRLREAVLSQKPPVGRLQVDVYRHLQHDALAPATLTSLELLQQALPFGPLRFNPSRHGLGIGLSHV